MTYKIIVKEWGIQSYYFAWKKKREKISRMDITKHFWESEYEKLAGGSLNISVSSSSFSSQLSATKELDTLQEKQDEKKKRQVLSEKIKKEAGHHILKYVIPEARRRDCKKNLSFTFAT